MSRARLTHQRSVSADPAASRGARPCARSGEGRRQDRHHRARHRARLRGQGRAPRDPPAGPLSSRTLRGQAGRSARLPQLRAEELFQRADTSISRRRSTTTLALAERIKPMVADVPRLLYEAQRAGNNLLFEGAQGTLLDVDHGTYPYVTSSNCVAGAARAGAGVGPQLLHYVLGITKAYTTRVGLGSVPDRARRRHRQASGRARQRVRFDHGTAAALRLVRRGGAQALDSDQRRLGTVRDEARRAGRHGRRCRLGIGYRVDGERLDILPFGAEVLAECEPVYEEMPGWSGKHSRRHALRAIAGRSAALPQAHRGNLRSAGRHDFDRCGARGDHRAAPSVRMTAGLRTGD